MKNNECEVIFVDFANRKKTSSQVIVSEKEPSMYDMSGFNPPQGNFQRFSDQELTENSDHILKHLSDLTVDDLVHFVSVGSLDKKKLAAQIGLRQEEGIQDCDCEGNEGA